MSAASAVVDFAVRLLPRNLRERYREQWRSDLRDATEAGISQGEIARGALAFAATVARPLPWSGAPEPTATQVERRSRVAAAIALGVAVSGLIGYATAFRWAVTGLGGEGGLQVALAVIAPVLPIAIVMRTRAVNSHVRLAVWLLVLPGFAPIVQRAIDGAMYGIPSPGSFAYVAGALIIAIALRLLWLGLDRGSGVTPSAKPSTYSALAVVVVGALCLGYAAQVWASRVPLKFSWLPAEVGYSGPDGGFIRESIPATQAMYEEWLFLKNEFEQIVAASFIGVSVGVALLVIAVIALSRVFRIRASTLAAAAIAIVLIATAMLLSFLDGAYTSSVVPSEVLQNIGQLLLLGVVLVAVGDLWFDPKRLARVRHRHDVEGGVELL